MKPRVRNTIYQHLAGYLPCGQATLVKRAKNLRQNPEGGNPIQKQMEKLSALVNAAMPAHVEKHNALCQEAHLAYEANRLKGRSYTS